MKYFNFFGALVLALLYVLGGVPPSQGFNLWLVAFLIPLGLVINLFLLGIGIVMRRSSAGFLAGALLIGSGYLFSSFGLKSFFKSDEFPDQRIISVLNYNLGGFQSRVTAAALPLGPGSPVYEPDVIEWVMGVDADIQCFQEFPYDSTSGRRDLLREYGDLGYDYFFSAKRNRWDGSRFGTLIVSRFPIVKRGDVMISSNGYNRIAFADIVIGRDTLRIINVHLQSMQMKSFHPAYSSTVEDRTRDIRTVVHKLKSGVFERSKQISQLIRFIRSSPHPVVCVGDFNELPYSYSYRKLKKHLKNAFEERGRGFGFTYNGNTLNMLRIDNQFYSSPLRLVSFHTLDTVCYTDHHPLIGNYVLR